MRMDAEFQAILAISKLQPEAQVRVLEYLNKKLGRKTAPPVAPPPVVEDGVRQLRRRGGRRPKGLMTPERRRQLDLRAEKARNYRKTHHKEPTPLIDLAHPNGDKYDKERTH